MRSFVEAKQKHAARRTLDRLSQNRLGGLVNIAAAILASETVTKIKTLFSLNQKNDYAEEEDFVLPDYESK